MKNIFAIVLLAVLMVGCSSESENSKVETMEKGEVVIVDGSEIKLRNGLYYEANNEKPFTGKVVNSYLNGQKKSEGYFKNGEPAGTGTVWYENGQKNIEMKTKNGKLEGLATQWYQNGQKKSEADYKNGKPDGLAAQWYQSGKKKSEANFTNGKPDGTATKWYDNGQKKSEAKAKNGNVVSETKWDVNGNILK